MNTRLFSVKYPAVSYGVFEPRGSRHMTCKHVHLARCFMEIKNRRYEQLIHMRRYPLSF